MQKSFYGKTQCCKVITFKPKMFVLLKFQFYAYVLILVYFILEPYFDTLSLVLGIKIPEKSIRERRNQNSKSAKIFRRQVMTFQH